MTQSQKTLLIVGLTAWFIFYTVSTPNASPILVTLGWLLLVPFAALRTTFYAPKVFTFIGHSFYNRLDFRHAIFWFKTAREIYQFFFSMARLAGNDRAALLVLYQMSPGMVALADCLRFNQEVDGSIAVLSDFAGMAESCGDVFETGVAAAKTAKAYQLKQSWLQADHWARRAVDLLSVKDLASKAAATATENRKQLASWYLSDAHLVLGENAQKRHEIDTAESHLNEILVSHVGSDTAMQLNLETAWKVIVLAVELKCFERCEPLLKSYLEKINQQYPKLRLTGLLRSSRFYSKWGKFAQAEQILQEGRANREYGETHARLFDFCTARLRQDEGRFEESITLYKHVIANVREEPDTGTLVEYLNRYSECLRLANRVEDVALVEQELATLPKLVADEHPA